METRNYLPADVARVFARTFVPFLRRGGRNLTLDKLDIVTENVYRRLPSGDYGRGDVRAAILDVFDAEGEA